MSVSRISVKFLLVLLPALWTGGCAVREPSVLTLAPGASLSSYRVFEVANVSNATGKQVAPGTVRAIKERLAGMLMQKGFPLAGSAAQGVLSIRPLLAAYEPGDSATSWSLLAPARCVLRAQLVDKASGESKGEVVSRQEVRGSAVLDMCVDAVVEALEEKTGKK